MSDIASYRVQLRGDMDFAALEARLDQIADLGVSHLYLSPILTAAPGSTHGYDVTDPTTIDPVLGGMEGFERLAAAARENGLSIILDIVPNHMAFGLDTPWLRDVLKKGIRSPHAPVFDIDWDAGPIALPWLEEPLHEIAARGDCEITGGTLKIGGLAVPLSDGSDMECSVEAIEALEERQHWRLMPWQMERDSITHRRFFSVTQLIGVRVELEEVFEAVHACVFDLVDRGLVQGLRIDHVDGLVDPTAYLKRLKARLPEKDIWVEKILVTGEHLRADWPVEGTTGYEAAAVIARALADRAGFEKIDTLWRAETGIERAFHPMVEEAKREVLVDELAAELRQLRAMAAGMAEAEGEMYGPESLREAVTELLVAFPRYRSNIGAGPTEEDVQLWKDAAQRAGENVRSSVVIDWLVERMLGAETGEARAFGVRMEQVTGALIAKAHEDTAGFRFNRYLAANEVGADPDVPLARPEEIDAALSERATHWPRSLTLGSSHDTKRSADARARIIALTHAPDAMKALWEDACSLPRTEELDANRRFYAFQIAVAAVGSPEAGQRAADHMVKALREGKEISYWTAPNEELEEAMGDWVRSLIARWEEDMPAPLLRILRIGETLSLREIAMRCAWPGMPDIYQGEEALSPMLTDPDNRRPPDWDELARLPAGDDPSSAKAGLLRLMLALRRGDPQLFASGSASWDETAGGFVLTRRLGDRSVRVVTGADDPEGEDLLWMWRCAQTGQTLAIHGREP